MKDRILGFLAAFVLGSVLTFGAAVSINFSAGQNTYTQNTLIPTENAAKCARFSTTHPLPGCTTAQLTTPNGTCVALPFSAVNLDNLLYQDCTIYTQDAAGEALFHADQLYKREISGVANDLSADIALTRAAWFAANQTARNSACTAIARPTACHFFQ